MTSTTSRRDPSTTKDSPLGTASARFMWPTMAMNHAVSVKTQLEAIFKADGTLHNAAFYLQSGFYTTPGDRPGYGQAVYIVVDAGRWDFSSKTQTKIKRLMQPFHCIIETKKGKRIELLQTRNPIDGPSGRHYRGNGAGLGETIFEEREEQGARRISLGTISFISEATLYDGEEKFQEISMAGTVSVRSCKWNRQNITGTIDAFRTNCETRDTRPGSPSPFELFYATLDMDPGTDEFRVLVSPHAILYNPYSTKALSATAPFLEQLGDSIKGVAGEHPADNRHEMKTEALPRLSGSAYARSFDSKPYIQWTVPITDKHHREHGFMIPESPLSPTGTFEHGPVSIVTYMNTQLPDVFAFELTSVWNAPLVRPFQKQQRGCPAYAYRNFIHSALLAIPLLGSMSQEPEGLSSRTLPSNGVTIDRKTVEVTKPPGLNSRYSVSFQAEASVPRWLADSENPPTTRGREQGGQV